MPRYYFDVKDGHRLVDPKGLECTDDEEAKRKAEIIAAQIAGEDLDSKVRWVAVIDDEGRQVDAIPVGRRATEITRD